jgi:hypothetical protein
MPQKTSGLVQPGLAGADLLGHAGAEVLDVDVGLADYLIEQRQVGLLASVERDTGAGLSAACRVVSATPSSRCCP